MMTNKEENIGNIEVKKLEINAKTDSSLIRSFGRIKTRKLSKSKEDRMQNLLPKISVNLPSLDDADFENKSEGKPQKLHKPEKIDPAKFFDFKPKEVWLEIGFGFGEHLFERAKSNKGVGIIGCEPHINGVASVLNKIGNYNDETGEEMQNIRILNGDARILLDNLKSNSLNKVFVLFPDPWTKKKHHKRRIIQLEFLDLLASKMKRGGILFFASDIEGYVNWTLEKVASNGKFKWTVESEKNWKQEPEWWVKTRYQNKAIREGRGSAFLEFKKV